MQSAVAHLSDRVVTVSPACTGVLSTAAADAMIMATIASKLVEEQSTAAPIKIIQAWGIEKDPKCQQELLRMQDGPAHLFSDLLDFLPDDVRILCDDDTVPKDVLKARIMACRTKAKARCLRCRAECAITKSDMHWAGTPCQDSQRLELE